MLQTAFGDLTYRERDLVVIPRGITFRWLPDGEPQEIVVLETTRRSGPRPGTAVPAANCSTARRTMSAISARRTP